MKDHDLSAEAAVEALNSRHPEATAALKVGLERYLKTRQAPAMRRQWFTLVNP